MVRLQEFNALLLYDLQIAREASGGRDGDQHGQGSLIATTLQRSDMFLQLIRELNHSINSNRSNQWDKVNTDVVLQLLSCNITTSHLYQMLCSQLRAWSAPPGEWDKGSVLPSLRFEGLAQMDTKLHLSTLVHVCGHVFVKIQKELEEMQQRELLTQAAHTMFQIALGAAGRENEVVGRGQSSVKTNVVDFTTAGEEKCMFCMKCRTHLHGLDAWLLDRGWKTDGHVQAISQYCNPGVQRSYNLIR